MFGDPFYPAVLDASWLTWHSGVVRTLAQSVYDDRAFDRLPILADALEEAGCCDTTILSHCRQKAEHIRGCFWVVDLILAKKVRLPSHRETEPENDAIKRTERWRNTPCISALSVFQSCVTRQRSMP